MLGAFLAPNFAFAERFSINANQITRFQGQEIGKPVGNGLVWRGGLHLTSESKDFGGLSDITFTSVEGNLAIVTDKGNFISGRMKYGPSGAPIGIDDADIKRLRNSKGAQLPSTFSRDSEAIDTVYRNGKPIAVRVGFEHLTRVADFKLNGTRPGGPAIDYTIPQWLKKQRNNGSIESLCIAPPASPVAGSTLMIAQDVRNKEGHNRAWLSGKRDGGDLFVATTGKYSPTACTFTPNGDLLILFRSVGIFGFSMQLTKVAADQVKARTVLTGELMLEASGGDVDNMEGLTTHIGNNGETIISVLSDDNFNNWERTLLLQFEISK
ncbi:esterase-like activity of phytase family protein [Maritalea sp.]|uniref:esterase-like activity of phytase family protein n=1 Tax=Maritalea sp. TaxID=2003361 RepID=UPI003EF166D1